MPSFFYHSILTVKNTQYAADSAYETFTFCKY